jgi:hypothetical protein
MNEYGYMITAGIAALAFGFTSIHTALIISGAWLIICPILMIIGENARNKRRW